jgi:Cof subfamily protein (haloacid dehalogenase superfamily)
LIKALFFDLDGTLLTSSRELSDKTKIALKACKERGIKLFTATARPPLLAKMLDFITEEDEFIWDGGIFYNGGCICFNNEKIYTFLHEQAVIRSVDVIKPYKEVNLAIQMENERHSFRYGLTDEDYKLWGVNNDELIFFEDLKYKNVVKIFVFSSLSLLPDLCDELIDNVGDAANVYLTGRGDFRGIEIVDKKINKKLAIDKLISMCGINHDEVAVFGDDFNDIEMLKGFKHSVAMGNACDEVKSCAGYITLSNDEEGIHYALSNILKLI